MIRLQERQGQSWPSPRTTQRELISGGAFIAGLSLPLMPPLRKKGARDSGSTPLETCRHNQTYKAHKNGIKRPKKHAYASRKGVRHSRPHSIFADRLAEATHVFAYSNLRVLVADGPQVPAEPSALSFFSFGS